MRIQHNITAMNSYRNYATNTKRVSGNLEKISTGYKINRAGDDAAGLAISEKMRVQITGLEQAQTNAKAGINLVQTGEGALTEVHDMLNRMYTLAEQSANGTYQDELDREQLQKEVGALRDEINRIAESTNYNGIKLLDGSLSEKGAGSTGYAKTVDLSGLQVAMYADGDVLTASKATKVTNSIFGSVAQSVANNDYFDVSVKYTDVEGQQKTVDMKLVIGKSNGSLADDKGIYLEKEDGTRVHLLNLNKAGSITARSMAAAIEFAAAKTELARSFNVKSMTTATYSPTDPLGAAPSTSSLEGKLKFESLTRGANGATVQTLTITKNDLSSTIADTNKAWEAGWETKVVGKDSFEVVDMGKAIIFDINHSAAQSKTTDNMQEAIFTINGAKFAFIQASTESNRATLDALAAAGVTHWVAVSTANSIGSKDVASMVNKIIKETGLKVERGVYSRAGGSEPIDQWTAATSANSAGTQVIFSTMEGTNGKSAGAGLNLQIGDTAEDFNRLTVSIKDMHAKAMGIGDIDISTEKGASDAMKAIKNAVNYVSDVRGTLGALQNRLDHTINNLGVMQENIQDAESTIRDTDIAKEMMNYTKNNILVQSSQAMLAQANQMPQGVLQLLG